MKKTLATLAMLSACSVNALTLSDYVPTDSALVQSIHMTTESLLRTKSSDLPDKDILIIDTSKLTEHDYQVNELKQYDSLLLVGGTEHVQKAMLTLFGFSVSGDALLVDNINGPEQIKIKRYAPNMEVPVEQKAVGLLKMLKPESK
ncbi:hypothetical protein [Vibrio campbellii]|jgi:hypothetical protein|uniref:DUF4174 domain-containing protein n=1 Tax=Vibrio campbellii TaxID=680 RepID=A0ABY5I7J7_9VIBR|nr:hypothetical protein [Vibrio campbellii]ARV73106.1 hypothetical protein A8140_10410 [Vibrio campbellii CAIM 519 = NBRC 15631 = ATCC 25920]ELU49299.1 hypothetical protein B878_24060 [Vibrio campbellii CAIM 519 = NBRC 15631 = ATCC 25920]UTZ22287.1 hypothetical protein HB760_10475 [Vibrio campbellii]UTZ30295.1 hypothetical protein HB762_02065 [Vibrio campbellii]UTZ37948.1 hypothetical protein HB763_15420 [Vibrio campbellii]